ncbi:putative two-component response regulator [Bacillus methanolicus PB1]|uniref:Putative two-component response regulator n=1 Tax=Bacillus methanolicus PB1 TaxID=997296 RepID=I3DYD3_BACMT|nr:response regulator transcription factor [Bacillus methanolicus]EIJ79254.1 putative two-component response regulator [Bacillus methanolicus PB1]
MDKTLLIVDDEPEIVELLRLYLENEGYKIQEAYDGAQALDIITKNQNIDLVLVDLMMPNIDGFQLIKKLRNDFHLPIIILSAKSEDSDKILGLGLGADDYIPKPFNPLEVVARVRAQLRRSYIFNNAFHKEIKEKESTRVVVGDLQLDLDSFSIIIAGNPKALTKTEYKILELLMSSPGRVYTKQQIFEKVWNDYYLGGGEEDNTINVHISKIREKIEENPKLPKYLKTIRGLGYKFEKEV